MAIQDSFCDPAGVSALSGGGIARLDENSEALREAIALRDEDALHALLRERDGLVAALVDEHQRRPLDEATIRRVLVDHEALVAAAAAELDHIREELGESGTRARAARAYAHACA